MDDVPHSVARVFPPLPGVRPRILVVDDELLNLRVVGSYFEEDHEVALADNGPMALELCRQQPPDLMLLDIVMPSMDGLEVCRLEAFSP